MCLAPYTIKLLISASTYAELEGYLKDVCQIYARCAIFNSRGRRYNFFKLGNYLVHHDVHLLGEFRKIAINHVQHRDIDEIFALFATLAMLPLKEFL